MTRENKNILAFCVPFAIWIGLQTLLPATAATYAIRSAATLAALLLVFLPIARKNQQPHETVTTRPQLAPEHPCSCANLALGLLGGLLVFALWVGPEHWVPSSVADFYRTWFCWPLGSLPSPSTEPSPYDPATCGWTLTIAKLIGSAFIIAPAEEIFFRSFLYRWLQRRDFLSVPRTQFDLSAFLWMILLFMLEHDRPLAAALAGAAYGILYIRCGLFAAIVAHMLTNLLLAVYVIQFGLWNFW